MLEYNRKAALEMSIGTIVIIVIGVSMLILGMVLVRSIMCKAIGLTENVNDQVEDELNKYFGEADSEVACIGEGGQYVKLAAGKTNIIFCTFRATEGAKYDISLSSYDSLITSLKKETLKGWIKTSSWTGNISPGDQSVKKAVIIQVPQNAPEGPIGLQLEIKRNGELIATKDLSFEVSRVGIVKSTIC